MLFFILISFTVIYHKTAKFNRKRDFRKMEENIKFGLTRDFLDKLKGIYSSDDQLISLRKTVAILLDRLSAIIAVDDKLNSKFQNNKVVVSNRNDTVAHQRFAIAHEIAHFIFDCEMNKEFYDTYNTDADYSKEPTEIRANLFAAELMMPYSDFESYIAKQGNNISHDLLLNKISENFGVPKTAVARRYLETEHDDLLIGTSYEGWGTNE